MLNRLKVLILMQLNERKKFKEMTKSKKLVYVLLRVLAIAIVSMLFTFVFFFFNNIMYLKVNKNFLIFLIGIIQILSIIANIALFENVLYLNKDNQMLFSYPAKHGEIFLSKLIVFYIREFTRNLYFIVPLLFGFAFFTSFSFAFLINMILFIILLPLFPILLSALLSLPVMMIKRFLKKIPIIQTLLNLSILSAIFIGIIQILKKLPVPLRILALYNSFITEINAFIGQANKFFLVFSNLVNTLFASRAFLDYLIIFGTAIVLVLLVYLLAMPLYFNIVSHFSALSLNKKHKLLSETKKSSFNAFLTKEVKSIFRTPGKLYSQLVFVVAFPFLMYIMNYIFNIINTNPLGDSLIIGFNIMIGLVLLTANNTMSATAISNEGEQFVLLKTSPGKNYMIVYSKMLINIIFSTGAILAGLGAILAVTQVGLTNLILTLVLFFIVNTAHIFGSFQIDILNPSLREYAKSGDTSTNPNAGKSILQGLLLSTLFTAVAIFFFLDSMVGGWIRLFGLALIYLIVRIILFMANLKVYFKRIEF